MDNNQLSKFFPLTRQIDPDAERAIEDVYKAAREFAFTLNSLLPESAAKSDLIMRVFNVVRDTEMALRLDGPSRMTPMIISSSTKQ